MFDYKELALPEVFVYFCQEDKDFLRLSKECAALYSATCSNAMPMLKKANVLFCSCSLCSAEINQKDCLFLNSVNQQLFGLQALFAKDSSPVQHVLDFCFLYKTATNLLFSKHAVSKNQVTVETLNVANKLAFSLHVETKELLAAKKAEFVASNFKETVLEYLALSHNDYPKDMALKPALFVASECFDISSDASYLYHTSNALLTKALVSNFNLDKNIGSDFYLLGPFGALRKLEIGLLLSLRVAQIATLDATVSKAELEVVCKLFKPKDYSSFFGRLENVVKVTTLLSI